MNAVFDVAHSILHSWGAQVLPVLMLFLVGLVTLYDEDNYSVTRVLGWIHMLIAVVTVITVLVFELVLGTHTAVAIVVLFVLTALYFLGIGLVWAQDSLGGAMMFAAYALPSFGYVLFHMYDRPSVALSIVAGVAVVVGNVSVVVATFKANSSD